MSQVIADQNRLEIRQAVGYNTNSIIVSAVSITKDSSSLWDTYGLAKGGTNEYNGRQVQINTPAGSIASGEKSFVSAFNATDKDATMTPAFTASLTILDTYEMWENYTIEEVNNAINQCIMHVTRDCLQLKETHTTFTETGKYEYNCLSSFAAIHNVEYVSSIGTDKSVHPCVAVWDPDTDVTATADTTIFSAGGNKFVVGGDCAAGDKIATDTVTSVDLSDCDELVFSIYSTTALTAGDYDILLDDTAACASVVESIDVPATTAYTKTTHVVSLANPSSDSAIISVGLTMTADKGAHTIYISDIRGQNSKSRLYKELIPSQWDVVKASTPLLKLTSSGLSVVGTDTLLRITGYQEPAVFAADTVDSTVDPMYLIYATTAKMFLAHGNNKSFDPKDRLAKGEYYAREAEKRLDRIRIRIAPDTRWIN